MKIQPFSYEEFKEIYSKVPRLCIDLVIISKSGLILTLRALPHWQNRWHLPGGTVFYKERIEDAVERIAKEEIGVSVKIIKTLGYIEFPSEIKERGFGWSVSIPILCEPQSEDFFINDDAFEVKAFRELPENMITEQKVFMQKNIELLK